MLDLGCFDGRDSRRIQQAGNMVTGVELLPEAAEAARKTGIDVHEFDLETPEWPLPPNQFDVVLAGEILEHLVNPDAFLENIRRHLKDSGSLIVTTPNVASLGRRLLLLAGKNPFLEFSTRDEINGFPAVGHVRYFTRETLIRLCAAHGFKPVEVTSDRLNLGPLRTRLLAQLFPSLAWRLIGRFRKVAGDSAPEQT